MKGQISDKKYAEFSFEDFLQDDDFISLMKHPTSETVEYWEQFQQRNQNLRNFEAAKIWIESIHHYHHTSSSEEIDAMRRAINNKKDRKGRSRRLYYVSAAVAAAGIALLIFFKFQGVMDKAPALPDITAFADVTHPDTKTENIQLLLSDKQTILIDRKEIVN